VQLTPPVAFDTARPLDLSSSTLRSVSPIHIEHLSNMGVGASMWISIVINGELCGLIACHHDDVSLLLLRRMSADDPLY
jgi:chemotaxis family two-component system sensor kinase Cph1